MRVYSALEDVLPSILLYQASPREITAVRQLLAQGGLVIDGDVSAESTRECLNPHPVLLVLLHPDLAANAEFEPAMVAATREGRRIIGVWPQGSAGAIPEPFKKYSWDQVVWDAERLRKAICGMSEPAYDSAGGMPQKAPTTDRNC